MKYCKCDGCGREDRLSPWHGRMLCWACFIAQSESRTFRVEWEDDRTGDRGVEYVRDCFNDADAACQVMDTHPFARIISSDEEN